MMIRPESLSVPVDSDAVPGGRGRPDWLGATVAIVFGLFYAYDLWEAISPLFELPAYYALAGLDPATVPWWLLIIGVFVPPIVFALAFLLGLRRNALEKALIYLVGLAVVASFSITMIFLEQVLRPAVEVVML